MLRSASAVGRSPEWKISAASRRAPIKQSQNPESVHAAMRAERSGASRAGARPLTNVVVQAAVQDSIETQNIRVRAQNHIIGSAASAPNPTGWGAGADCIRTARENRAGI